MGTSNYADTWAFATVTYNMIFLNYELGIDIVFTAHLHTYRNRGHIYNFDHSSKGPLYILTGVAGNIRYPHLWKDHALDIATLPQPETDNYLTMEVTDKKLTVKCFLPDGTQMDEASVTK